MRARNATSIVALLAASCGSGSSTISQSDFPAQYAAALCQKIIGCCSTTPGLPSQPDCVTVVQHQYASALQMLVANPRLTYSGGAGALCVSELNAAPCTALEFTASVPDCALVVSGTVADGQPCTATGLFDVSECKSKLCVNLDNAGSGVCAAPGASGQACVTTSSEGPLCAAGTFANQTSGCVCQPTKSNGAGCSPNTGECSSQLCDDNANPPVCAPARLSPGTCGDEVSSL